MARVVYLLALLVSLSLLTAQNAPAQTKVLKDDEKVCQVLVPADWQPDSMGLNSMHDPKDLITVNVMWERDFKVEPMSETETRMSRVEKIFENTAQRIFYQGKTVNFGPVPTTGWTVFTPAPQKGACHLAVSMKPGANEQAAKNIALTLGPAK